jgi:hypothetical protein
MIRDTFKLRRFCIALALALSCLGGAAQAQTAYKTAEEAARAFVNALAVNDPQALSKVLGADWKRFIPTQGVDSEDIIAFLAAWAKSNRVVTEGKSAHLQVGPEQWQLPIPIVQGANGWRFDTRAGAEEIRTRRIGRNELNVMKALLAVYDAQKEYATADHNGDGVLQYAERLISTPGKQDGLYWAALPGEPESPLGPLFDEAVSSDGYHGYRFKLLTSQGANAPGGAYDYRIKNRLVGGFAILAWPARYGDTGVMSFMVSHSGTVYEKDLGPSSAAAAKALTRFNPDATWKAVKP